MSPVEKLEAAIAILESQTEGYKLDYFADPLFVRLFGTVPVQLAILKHAKVMASGGSMYTSLSTFGFLSSALADAILGDPA